MEAGGASGIIKAQAIASRGRVAASSKKLKGGPTGLETHVSQVVAQGRLVSAALGQEHRTRLPWVTRFESHPGLSLPVCPPSHVIHHGQPLSLLSLSSHLFVLVSIFSTTTIIVYIHTHLASSDRRGCITIPAAKNRPSPWRRLDCMPPSPREPFVVRRAKNVNANVPWHVTGPHNTPMHPRQRHTRRRPLPILPGPWDLGRLPDMLPSPIGMRMHALRQDTCRFPLSG